MYKNAPKAAANRMLKRIEKYVKEIDYLRAHYVAVGLPAEHVATYDDGAQVIDVGVIHEYGTATIDERSWLRMPTQRNQKKITDAMDFRIEKIGSGKLTGKSALNQVGMMARNHIMEAFKTSGYGTWPDIAEETKERKGSSGILKDTGLLMQSITWVVRNASQR